MPKNKKPRRKIIFLSIVIPAYNEEKRIQKTLLAICDYFKDKDYKYELVVVDDGSNDKTLEILEKYKKHNENLRIFKNIKNKSKGYSLKRGMLESRGELILFSDADLSTPIEEVEKLIFWINGGYDIAIGSRVLPDSDICIHQPYYRILAGRVFNFLVRKLVIKGIGDTQCGFKLFKSETAQHVLKKQSLRGFSFDVEVLFLAHKYGYKIKEVPIRWANALDSKISLIKHTLPMVIGLLKIKINNLLGNYNSNA